MNWNGWMREQVRRRASLHRCLPFQASAYRLAYATALMVGATLVTIPTHTAAAVQDEEPTVQVDDSVLGGETIGGTLPLNLLEIDAAPVPNLALRHRLYLDDADRVEGNAVHAYMRAHIMASENKSSQQTYYDRYEAWLEQPVTEATAEEMKTWLGTYENVLAELKRASVCRDCEWDLGLREHRTPREAFMILLPEIQGMRELARILQVKAMYEISQRDYDGAVETIRQLYQIGFDTAKTPILVSTLVGSAAVGMATATVERLIAAPESPNLYWGLMTLPQPLIEIRPAIRHELGVILSGFEYLDDPENVTRSKEEWNRILLRDFGELMSFAGGSNSANEFQNRMLATTFALRGFPIAKRELMKTGYTEEQLDAMPVAQVVAIHQGKLYRRLYDRVYRLTYRPLGEQFDTNQRIDSIMRDLDIRQPTDSDSVEVFPFASMLMPAIGSAMAVPVRMQRHVEALKTVELVRMTMASNESSFPKSVEAFADASVPHDPVTSQPFPYELVDGRARIVVRLPESLRAAGFGMVIELQQREQNQSK